MSSIEDRHSTKNYISLDIAILRLESYTRVTKASLKGHYGATSIPALHLSDEILSSLFTPSQINGLLYK